MDIVKLLPDSVANQIAAGEVIQRPASVVKELMENAVDAGATEVELIIKEAGKKLIQVVDNGRGMTEVDARMSFERHATSKIDKAEDLFALRTKGFRGEALASIAAIAHVELKTRSVERELGTRVRIHGSKVETQEPIAHPLGSSFSVKNLFYNVPARRKFLKSDTAEMKHIVEEFVRVALPHPQIKFSLYKDGHEMYKLGKGNHRQRIVGLMGNSYDPRLVPVEEHTDVISISGFVGKPEFAKKTRGEQYLFLNDRFIKHHYLHHALVKAYDNLLPEKSHPTYFLFMQVDPARVDVNIHPTKTEVKFDEERSIYMILNSAIRQSLGKFNIAPSLDFETEGSFDLPPLQKDQAIKIPEIRVDETFNPFESDNTPSSKRDSVSRSRSPIFEKKERVSGDNWKQLYEIGRQLNMEVVPAEQPVDEVEKEPELALEQPVGNRLLHHFNQRYILTSMKGAVVFIHPSRAHERILYEDFIKQIAFENGQCQQLLFPETVELNPQAMSVILENKQTLRNMGFDIEEFGKQTLKINGCPVGIDDLDCQRFFSEWTEDFLAELNQSKNSNETMARTMARRLRYRGTGELSSEEMQDLIDRLFSTEQPYHSPSGLPTIVNMDMNELDRKFERIR